MRTSLGAEISLKEPHRAPLVCLALPREVPLGEGDRENRLVGVEARSLGFESPREARADGREAERCEQDPRGEKIPEHSERPAYAEAWGSECAGRTTVGDSARGR